jgi:methionyl-tRNA formyltransferase
MARALGALERGTLACTPQSADGVTYASKIDKNETRIDWTQPVRDILNKIRGLSPAPGAWFEALVGAKPTRIKVLRAKPAAGSGAPGEVLSLDPLTVATGGGAIMLLDVQRSGKRPTSAEAFLRGAPLKPGSRLA